jgi:hypothetical protein
VSTEGVCFDYEKPLPVVIHALPLQVAQANLDAYDATCPGPYRLDLPANHQHNEAWRKWSAGRQEHLTALTIAKACNGSPVHAPKKAQPVNPGHAQAFPVQHFVDRINGLIQQMDREPEGSPEWFRLRQLASSCRHAAMKRARGLRDRSTIIPEIPRKRRTCRLPMPSPTIGVKRNAYFKPLAHFVAKLQVLLDQMAKLDPWTNEWEALRDRACAARSAAQRRAYETGDTTTPIPEVPRRGARVIPR